MGPFLKASVALGVVFLSLPTLIVTIASVNPAESIVFPPHGATLHWYSEMIGSGTVRTTLWHSLIVSVESVGLGLLVGIPAALGLYRYQIKRRTAIGAFLSLGFSTPVIVSAVCFLLLYTQLGVLSHLTSVGVALAIVNLPAMLWAVTASTAAVNPELDDAAATLGAEEIQRFLFVTVPSLAPGIIIGALLMFVFGITDLLVSLLLVNSSNMTLPVYLFGSIRTSTSPLLAAVGVLYIVLATVALGAVLRIGRVDHYLHRGG
jgi:putative spermidine/putrescine transport system permease protein